MFAHKKKHLKKFNSYFELCSMHIFNPSSNDYFTSGKDIIQIVNDFIFTKATILGFINMH